MTICCAQSNSVFIKLGRCEASWGEPKRDMAVSRYGGIAGYGGIVLVAPFLEHFEIDAFLLNMLSLSSIDRCCLVTAYSGKTRRFQNALESECE